AFVAGKLSATSLQSVGDLTLTVTDTAALGTVSSTAGSVSIDPALLTFDSITANKGITLSGGTITGGTLDAGTSVNVSATGDLTLDLADAGTTLSLGGANVQAGTLRSNGATSITATDLASITSAINSGGGISITATRFTAPLLQAVTGNIALSISGRADLTTVAAFGGNLTIDADTLRFVAASALGVVQLRGADLAGTTVASGTSTNINAGTVANIGSVTAGTSATLGGLDVTVGTVSAGTFTDFDGRSINVGETTAGTTAFVDARNFTFDKLTAGESVEILTSANTNGGKIDAGTTLRIAASGDVTLDDAKAGGAITIGAANINALTITGDSGLSLTATNAIDLGTVKVLGAFDLSGASLVLGSSSSGLDSTFSLTGSATIGSVAAGLASTGQNLVQIVVQALGNSFTGGTLVPVFDVVQGQTITVSSSTNDLWSAGFLPRFSDGDGLIAFRIATAQDDSGAQPGTQIGAAFGNLTIGNFSAPFGALVGQIGNQNVLIGANGTVTAPATGTLSVGYWDSNAGDNTGSIAFTFGNGTGGGGASNPANVSITTGGNLTVGSANASSAITLDAAGALKLDSADAGTTLALTGNTIDAGTLKAGTDITLASNGASVIGSATAGGRFSADIGALDFTLIDAASAVDIASLAGVSGGDIRSGASIVVDASGSITIRDADAATDLALTSGAAGDITARTLAAGGAIGIEGRDVSLGSATAAGSFTVSGTGAVELGTASAGSALSVNSQTLTFTRMSSGGTLVVGTSGDVTGGDLVATGTMRINTGSGRFAYGTLDGGDIAIVAGSASGGAIRVRAGDLNLGVAGDATVGAINASGNVAIDAQRLVFSTISAGGTFGTTNGSMSGTSISAGNDVFISSQGNVALSGLTGKSARINSAGIVNITGLQLSGAISVFADAVGLDALGNLAIRTIIADRGNVDVTAEGSITGSTINALGDIDLLASNGDVMISHLSAGYADAVGDSVRPQGTVTSGAIGQGNIDIVAAGDIVINDVADAAKAFTMNAGNTIRLNGLATGATMDLTSADLEIGASGRLGETAHTDAITLRNTGQGPLRLGDNIASTVSGYAISQAEFARIRSRGDLTIRANQALLVGDLAVVAQAGTTQGQVGETGTLSLRSGGLATFLGALSMSNAAGNSLAVNSQNGVFLDAATGSIRLLDGEARAGTLAISGSGIAMVTRSALDDISQLTDTALITDRLGLNDGVTDGRTLVEADTIQLRSDREVYIQNTSLGTRLDDRRGLVANSLKIGSRDGSQLDIVINGIVNGQVGVDAIEQITFEEAFTDLSSVNGCVIVNANTCNKLPFEIIELRDLVEEVLKTDPEDSALQVTDSFTKTTLIQLNQIAPAGFEPLIDEPVTGTGNDDLLGEGKQDGE
ncbi:beta strand repeat-containing protein, partial [Novosphingobium jiangmenense]